jgi:AraC-like DNA-binding protein
MQYQYQQAPAALSAYIRTVLVAEGVEAPRENQLPLFTNGQPALLCHTTKTATGTTSILLLNLFGVSAPADQWNLEKSETLIAYFFTPFSMACLFNLPAQQLAKAPVALSEWNAHQANALKTQLSFAGTTEEKTAVLDNLLLNQLKQQEKECNIIRTATDEMMLNPGKEILPALLKKLALNERTFQRIFKKYVGITPSQYRRICQFKDSFDHLRSGEFEKLTDVAYEAGFADQSHFIRSFKEFTDTTPNDYKRSGLKRK